MLVCVDRLVTHDPNIELVPRTNGWNSIRAHVYGRAWTWKFRGCQSTTACQTRTQTRAKRTSRVVKPTVLARTPARKHSQQRYVRTTRRNEPQRKRAIRMCVKSRELVAEYLQQLGKMACLVALGSVSGALWRSIVWYGATVDRTYRGVDPCLITRAVCALSTISLR